MILLIIVGIFLWVVASIYYLLTHLGKKSSSNDSWYIWVLETPLLLLALILGAIWNKK